MRIRHLVVASIVALSLAAFAGCKKGEEAPPAGEEQATAEGAAEGGEAPAEEAAPKLEAGPGVDVDSKTITIGALNDESGPAAAIGKPYAVGKRIAAAAVNAGDLELLPDGWKVEIEERDHAYNPQKSVQAYNEIKGDVLFIATVMGTPNTLPLRPMLKRDGIIAFPASLSSKLAEHRHTPPLGPSYELEALRAMDWVVASVPSAEEVKAAIIYQKDDYGEDGRKGWKKAAEHYDVEIVSEQTVAPGQKDFAAVVSALDNAGATHVLLTTLPSSTGPILGTAAQLEFMPTWIGNTPAWIDRFFDPEVIPAAVFAKFHWMNGLPYWGEDVDGMDDFLAAWEAHGKDMGEPDFYILLSYIQGLVQLEAARRAIESGDITRDGYRTALTGIESWDAGGMIQPVDLSNFPYQTGTKTRILKPKMGEGTWEQVAPWAEPKAL